MITYTYSTEVEISILQKLTLYENHFSMTATTIWIIQVWLQHVVDAVLLVE